MTFKYSILLSLLVLLWQPRAVSMSMPQDMDANTRLSYMAGMADEHADPILLVGRIKGVGWGKGNDFVSFSPTEVDVETSVPLVTGSTDVALFFYGSGSAPEEGQRILIIGGKSNQSVWDEMQSEMNFSISKPPMLLADGERGVWILDEEIEAQTLVDYYNAVWTPERKFRLDPPPATDEVVRTICEALLSGCLPLETDAAKELPNSTLMAKAKEIGYLPALQAFAADPKNHVFNRMRIWKGLLTLPETKDAAYEALFSMLENPDQREARDPFIKGIRPAGFSILWGLSRSDDPDAADRLFDFWLNSKKGFSGSPPSFFFDILKRTGGGRGKEILLGYFLEEGKSGPGGDFWSNKWAALEEFTEEGDVETVEAVLSKFDSMNSYRREIVAGCFEANEKATQTLQRIAAGNVGSKRAEANLILSKIGGPPSRCSREKGDRTPSRRIRSERSPLKKKRGWAWFSPHADPRMKSNSLPLIGPWPAGPAFRSAARRS